MLVSVAAFCLLCSEEKLNVPAGFYTLTELAQSLKTQYIRLTVDKHCARNVYALRFKDASWNQLRMALTQDERLSITKSDDGWAITMDSREDTQSAAALARYLKQIKENIYSLYGPVAEACYALDELPEDQRDAEIAKYPKNGDPNPIRSSIGFFVSQYGTPGFSSWSFSMVAALTSPQATSAFGKLESDTLARSHSLFPFSAEVKKNLDRSGLVNFTQLSQEQIVDFQSSTRCYAKLILDPVTATTGQKLLLQVKDKYVAPYMRPAYLDKPCSLYLPYLWGGINHYLMPPVFESNVLWGNAHTDALKQREKETQLFMDSAEAGVPGVHKKGPLRLSTAFLTAAEAANANLVYYVSPFTDWHLKPGTKLDLLNITKAINKREIDPIFNRQVQSERYGDEQVDLQPVRIHPNFSVRSVNNTLIVRNETRFLDGLCSSPPCFSSKIENQTWRTGKVGFAELCSDVESFEIPSWKTSTFSSNLLDHCNPSAFQPFASLFLVSKVFRNKVANVEADGSVDVPISELEPGPWLNLRRLLASASRSMMLFRWK